MNQLVQNLVKLLDVSSGPNDVFRGDPQDLGFRNLFGGQVLAQSLVAACKTVTEFQPHSLHGYFLRPGKVSEPIDFEVDRLRDGRTFTTRRVVAKQLGKAIFNMSASFQLPEGGYNHQVAMPYVPGPDDLKSDRDIARENLDKIPEDIREKFMQERPVELRTVDQINYFRPNKRTPNKQMWFRFKQTPQVPSETLKVALLAYCSDFGLLGTALLPHGVSFVQPEMQVTSLDHAMWFHRDFDWHDWLLYTMESPSAQGARGLVSGKIFNRQGVLVASTAQEGLMRRRS